MKRRAPLDVVITAGLVVLVAALAVFQYRWLGSVSDAERTRLRESLTQRANDLARDVDRAITDVFETFQSAGDALGRGDGAGFAARVDAWTKSPASAAKAPLVKAIYRITPSGDLERFDRGTFAAAEWTAELSVLRRTPAVRSSSGVMFETMVRHASGPFIASIPALVIPVPSMRQFDNFQGPAPRVRSDVFSFRFDMQSLVVALDREYLTTKLLPMLVERSFPSASNDFRLAILENAAATRAFYSRGVPGDGVIDPAQADVNVEVFTIRRDEPLPPSRVVVEALGSAGRGTEAPTAAPRLPTVRLKDTSAQVFVEQRTTRGTATFTALQTSDAGMRLLAQHVSGSLDAVVAQARRRNLMLSFGMLTLLGVSAGLLVVNARRTQKLAAQQMDFVAAISHELRTPIAVIRSAGQNLSAGLVGEAAQTRRYGELIEKEGRRLTDMVEEVLEFAGLDRQPRALPSRAVDLVQLAREVAADPTLAESTPAPIEVASTGDVPPVKGDEASLARVLRNLVGNALKYGAGGGPIGISVGRHQAGSSESVRLRVQDAGPGIDAEDLPHVFEPFYRGRRAIERQIRGNGLGLALVKRIVEAHGGMVRVDSEPGHGATFTVDLPALTMRDA